MLVRVLRSLCSIFRCSDSHGSLSAPAVVEELERLLFAPGDVPDLHVLEAVVWRGAPAASFPRDIEALLPDRLGWSLPTREVLHLIRCFVPEGATIVDVGAGSGLWMRVLQSRRARQATGTRDRVGDSRSRRDRRPSPHQPMVPLPRYGPTPRPGSGRGSARAQLVLPEPGTHRPADRRTAAIPVRPPVGRDRNSRHPLREHQGAHGPGRRLRRGVPARDRARSYDIRGRRGPHQPQALKSAPAQQGYSRLCQGHRGRQRDSAMTRLIVPAPDVTEPHSPRKRPMAR